MGEDRQMKFYTDLMTTVGLDPKDSGGSLNFTGPTDPIYDSPYFLGEGISAILGSIGSAVAQIWKMRSGEEQEVEVNRLHAIQALHRVNFLTQNGYPIILTAPFNATGLMHRCRDGRFFEATTTTRHLELAMLDLLDCANNDASCREAYMKWNAFELEEAVAHHNLCGAVHRTRAEWRAHPQGIALAQLPVITIEKIGDSAPEPFGPADRPLAARPRFGRDYIVPVPFDPRLIYVVPIAVAKAAMASGVARRPIVDLVAYKAQLSARRDPIAGAMQRIVERVRRMPKRVVFVEGEEEQVIHAACWFVNQGLGAAILVHRFVETNPMRGIHFSRRCL